MSLFSGGRIRTMARALAGCDAGMGRFIRLGPLTAPIDAVIEIPVRVKEPDSCCDMNARYSLLKKKPHGSCYLSITGTAVNILLTTFKAIMAISA